MQWLDRARNGQEPLWRVFWLYSFAPLFVAFLVGGILNKMAAGDAAVAVRQLFWLKIVVFPYAAFSAYLVFLNLHNIVESRIYARASMMCCIFWTLWLLHSIGLGPNLPPPPHPKYALIVASPPAAAPQEVVAPETAARYECTRKMNDYALSNKVDPQKYISSNQSYLQKCTEYLMNKNAQPQTR